MSVIKPSKRVLLFLVLIAGGMLLCCVLAYYKTSSRLDKLQAEVKAHMTALANSKLTAKQLLTEEQAYKDDQLTLDVLERGVSTKAYVPTLLRQMEDLGKSSKLKVVGLKPKPLPPAPPVRSSAQSDKSKGSAATKVAPKSDPYDKLPVEIDVVGKYWDVVSFLEKVASFPKIIAVEDIQVTPQPDVNKRGSPMLTVKLDATAFILKEGRSGSAGKVEETFAVGSEVGSHG
jgi:Tfp pilus assembly protein PilO